MDNLNNILSDLSSNKIILVILIIAAIFILSRIIKKLLNKASERYINRRILIKNFIPLINISITIGGLLFILFGVLSLSATAMTALWLSAGVALGFASQTLIGNIFGGLIIIFTRPFTIGDKITVKEYYGEVVDINLLKVKIQTPDDSLVTIPCKTVLEDAVADANSGELNCQVVIEMFLPGNIDILETKRIAYEAVYSSPYSYLQKPVVILFHDVYKETALLKLKIKAYVFDHRYEFIFSSDICERIKHYFAQHNSIPPDFYRLPGFISPGPGKK
jgi:small-conductance mechanosensitive channel